MGLGKQSSCRSSLVGSTLFAIPSVPVGCILYGKTTLLKVDKYSNFWQVSGDFSGNPVLPTQLTFQIFKRKYRNDSKFSDRYAWANSADPDQTAPRGS